MKEIEGKSEAQTIFAALTTAMSETAELEVITCIDSSDLDQVEPSQSQSHLSTRINLLDQTIDHEIDLKLIDNPAYRELKRWHMQQVKQRQHSLVKNLIGLEEMRKLCLNDDQA